jgi:anaerobic magnesium-protoporphyrin IX monomethyl ester cyclase
VLLVGRHVSALPKETIHMSSSLQAVAISEYEYTERDWLEAKFCDADLSAVDCLVWRSGTGEIVTNKQRAAIHNLNLDKLPLVSEVYKRCPHAPDYFYGHSLWPLVVFDTSRGCPYHCSFCVYPQIFSGHTMCYRWMANVVDGFELVSTTPQPSHRRSFGVAPLSGYEVTLRSAFGNERDCQTIKRER